MTNYTHQTVPTQFVEAGESALLIAVSVRPVDYRWSSTSITRARWTIGTLW